MTLSKAKGTYALDGETALRLEEIAQRWGVSKSEALRRAIQSAARQDNPSAPRPLETFRALTRSLALTEEQAKAWVSSARSERKSASRTRDGRSQ